MTSRPLKILFLAAEVVPFAKTGGLADVAGSLPKALQALGQDIRISLPRYGRIDREKFGLRKVLDPFPVPLDNSQQPAEIWETSLEGLVPVYMVENQNLFDREGIYMYPDDAERFIFWSRASLEMLPRLNWIPDIIHTNDWHTALIPNWLKTVYRQSLPRTATLYTIHNLAYQGIFGHRVLEIAGVAEYGFEYQPQMADLNRVVNFMGRGIQFADAVSTVSETYAREILTPEFGEGMDPLLRERKDRVFGILNGIDSQVLDPASDPHIAVHFDGQNLEPRVENKLALQKEAGLETSAQIPLVGMISRLTDQKGFDLLIQILEPLLNNHSLQFVLLGTGEERYHQAFQNLARRFAGRVAVFLTFNTPLAQRIYAGSDIFLMPSRFEPCGLGQMIAMRYGSVPVVRRTGGLADTVQDFDPQHQEGTGFVFTAYEPMALYGALVRALETYKHRDIWRSIMLRGMSQDFSWQASAQRYLDLYHRALAMANENEEVETAIG
ncbi:MAG: glycogen synthase GlgA [Chloroflexi bacterium]|nr:glycogen synthase GlgA [Chloroflexota bacterium]